VRGRLGIGTEEDIAQTFCAILSLTPATGDSGKYFRNAARRREFDAPNEIPRVAEDMPHFDNLFSLVPVKVVVCKIKAVAEALAMIADAHPESAPQHQRPVRETDEWLWQSSEQFCATMNRYAERESPRKYGRSDNW
jgi:hypothetical protein